MRVRRCLRRTGHFGPHEYTKQAVLNPWACAEPEPQEDDEPLEPFAWDQRRWEQRLDLEGGLEEH